jgi:glucose/arabinose dehydrogenase/predicted nucleotidyltransferase
LPGVNVAFLEAEPLIARLKERAQALPASHPRVLEVGLFGSLVRGDYAPGSDADLLAILEADPRRLVDRIPELLEGFGGLGSAVDVFPYTAAEIEAMKDAGFSKPPWPGVRCWRGGWTRREVAMAEDARLMSRWRQVHAGLGWLWGVLAVVWVWPAGGQTLPLERIKLPPGFRIEVYAGGVANARSLALSPNGTVFVGTRQEGKVYAVVDRDGDRRADQVITIAEGLNMPNGVAFRDGALYVAEVSRVLRFDGIEARLNNPPKPVVVTDALPRDRHHGWKFIAFGPDGWLYVPVGAPCNICERDPDRYAVIMRLRPDGTGLQTFARGIRNTVGFDWHPQTRELWFTDNGRDWMGDDLPPDELNRAPRPGLHFGYPYCHGGTIPDPEFGDKRACAEFVPPVQNLGPHVAALGMRFYTGTMFPPAYRQQIFIAEHGSWNRSTPIGYRVTLVRLDGDRAVSYEVFAEGWLQGSRAWGRPVDVLVMPDGALLVSDDRAGVIYRISYRG